MSKKPERKDDPPKDVARYILKEKMCFEKGCPCKNKKPWSSHQYCYECNRFRHPDRFRYVRDTKEGRAICRWCRDYRRICVDIIADHKKAEKELMKRPEVRSAYKNAGIKTLKDIQSARARCRRHELEALGLSEEDADNLYADMITTAHEGAYGQYGENEFSTGGGFSGGASIQSRHGSVLKWARDEIHHKYLLDDERARKNTADGPWGESIYESGVMALGLSETSQQAISAVQERLDIENANPSKKSNKFSDFIRPETKRNDENPNSLCPKTKPNIEGGDKKCRGFIEIRYDENGKSYYGCRDPKCNYTRQTADLIEE